MHAVASAGTRDRFLAGREYKLQLSSLEGGTYLRGAVADLAGKSVMIAARDQLTTAIALLELDGIASRLVLCPSGLPESAFPALLHDAAIDAVITDYDFDDTDGSRAIIRAGRSPAAAARPAPCWDTEWVLFTSGTTGQPKMVAHSLQGLAGAVPETKPVVPPVVWATFYDMRRYGGLQIFLRAMLGGCSFVMSNADEPLSEHLDRLAAQSVTNISGTPSHWRRVLMNPNAKKISPAYVRLSGEIADQGVLDGLRSLYPEAQIVHAYASTEAGVGFEVHDGLEGFPASFLGERDNGVTISVKDGSLRLKSSRAALRYISDAARPITDSEGFVDTGDLVDLRGGRYFFAGRRDGVINVGGQKVHPEEVEAVINTHGIVQMSLVRAQKSSMLGSLVVADVVADISALNEAGRTEESLRREIHEICASRLDRHKVPAMIRFVPSLRMTAGGKMDRNHA